MNAYPIFINKSFIGLLLVIILASVILFSFSTLTTKPQIWVDEAKSIELARNFLNFGKLNIQVAPGEFTDFPEILQSTGYPVTVSLAAIFKIFGYGLVQARIFMLGWMLAALLAVFMLGRRLFGDSSAIFAVLLIASFASFYDSGRTVVGEIPGFVFLMLGLYLWLEYHSYFGTGFLWGLSVVSKPSVFTWIIPTIILILLLEKKDFLKRIFKIGAGMLPAALGWIFLVLEKPLSSASWVNILNFYKNPYHALSLLENVFTNLSGVLYSATLIYFGVLFFVVLAGWHWNEEVKPRKFYQFAIIYGIFAFIYYLRSPGWLRYILISELLILFLLPDALNIIIKKSKEFFPAIKPFSFYLATTSVFLLFLIQIMHLFTAADIFYSNSAIQAAQILNREFPDSRIATIDSFTLSVLLETQKRSQYIEMAGLPAIGKKLLFDPLPEVVVLAQDGRGLEENRSILENNYQLYSRTGNYFIYSLK